MFRNDFRNNVTIVACICKKFHNVASGKTSATVLVFLFPLQLGQLAV